MRASSEAALPAGWRGLPAATLRQLLRARTGRIVKTKREAITFLEKEMKHG